MSGMTYVVIWLCSSRVRLLVDIKVLAHVTGTRLDDYCCYVSAAAFVLVLMLPSWAKTFVIDG